MTFKSTAKCLLALLLLALAVLVAVSHYAADRQRNAEVEAVIRELSSLELSQWVELLNPQRGAARTEDFESIDFSLLEDPTYGDNPDAEFFNPNGKFRAVPLSAHYLESLNGNSTTQVIFNVRRYTVTYDDNQKNLDKEGRKPLSVVSDGLYAVIPVSIECTRADYSLDVPANNRAMVEDPKRPIGCLSTLDGKHSYYFMPLAWRSKTIEGVSTDALSGQ